MPTRNRWAFAFPVNWMGMHPHMPPKETPSGWRERLVALKNVPPLLRMVWATSPLLAFATVALRAVGALLPIATLYVAKLIIDRVVAVVASRTSSDKGIWYLLAFEL